MASASTLRPTMAEKDTLPPPVTASIPLSSRSPRFAPPPAEEPPSQAARIRVHWARLRRRIGSGSVEAASDSYNEDNTLDGSLTWRRASDHPNRGSQTQQAWNIVGGAQDLEHEEVDEVVVDNEFEGYTCNSDGEESQTGRGSMSEKPPHPETSSHNHPTTDKDSTNTVSIWDRSFVLSAFRYRIVPVIGRFHSLAFNDPVAESQYMRESWYAWAWILNLLPLSAFLLRASLLISNSSGIHQKFWG